MNAEVNSNLYKRIITRLLNNPVVVVLVLLFAALGSVLPVYDRVEKYLRGAEVATVPPVQPSDVASTSRPPSDASTDGASLVHGNERVGQTSPSRQNAGPGSQSSETSPTKPAVKELPAAAPPAPEMAATVVAASTVISQDLVGAPGAVEFFTPGMDAATRGRFESYLNTVQTRSSEPAPYALSIQVFGPQMAETSDCSRAPTVDIRYSLRRKSDAGKTIAESVSGAGCLNLSLDTSTQERIAERKAAGALIDSLRSYFDNNRN